jgi:hypothetical protein
MLLDTTPWVVRWVRCTGSQHPSFKDVNFVEYTDPGDWAGGAVTIKCGDPSVGVISASQCAETTGGGGGGGGGGECPVRFHKRTCPSAIILRCILKTVGLAGDYIQGGGHGPMAGL